MTTTPKSSSKLKTRQELQVPKMYKVLMHNDDVTPMDFVVSLLTIIFRHSENKAHALMMKVHTEGVALCGVYTFEIAETRTLQAKALAESHSWPLKLSIETENDHTSI